MNNSNVAQRPAGDSHQEFAIDTDNFQALNENTNMSHGDKNSPSPQQPVKDQSEIYDVKNVEDDGNGFFITGINTHDQQHDKLDNEPQRQDMQQIDEEDENLSFDPADKYKHLAVVDCSKAFSNQECVLISDKAKTITYLNVSNQVSFKFDNLVTSHGQVQHLCNRLIHKFFYPLSKNEKDKIVLNLADQFNCNNNAGFNLTNFKVKFINQFFSDVITDYEKSIIGTFTKTILDKLNEDPKLADIELYFTITKFENDIGFSLIHQDEETANQQFPSHLNNEANIDNFIQKGNQDINDNSNNLINLKETNSENEGSRATSPTMNKDEQMRQWRKAQLTKHGVIPEFIKINEIYQVYTAFTQANLKNSILHQKQARKFSLMMDEPISNYKETELKEDILIIQFKLVNKNSYKTINTFSFINVPLSKIQDNNVATLIEILNKFKKQSAMKGKKKNEQSNFIPYNKSILTRVIAEQIQKNNILCLSHFSKSSINMNFKHSSGPAKNLFHQIENLFGDKPGIMIRKKLNDQQALKVLQQKFKSETQQIFGQLEQFREGVKSIEVYTQQAASQMPKSLAVKGSVTPNMFQQILQFLSLKDEIIQGYEEGNSQSLFMRQMPTHDIQKVIFDKNYIKFTQQRQVAQEASDQIKQQIGFGSTTGYASNNFISNQSNTTMPLQADPVSQFQMNRLQYVQYECIKTELKEEYDKRINFLHKRIEKRQAQQGPYQDAHLILMQNNIADVNEQKSNKSSNSKFGTAKNNGSQEFFLPGMKEPKAVKDYKKNVRGLNQGGMGSQNKDLSNSMNVQEKEQYYRFYLDSAQKAIEMMRKQHKSASLMRLTQEQNVGQNQMGSFTFNQPNEMPLPMHQQFMSENQDYDSKSQTKTNNQSNSNRVLEPLFAGQKPMTQMSQNIDQVEQNKSINFYNYAQPKLDMIQEDSDIVQQLQNKPFSAAHAQRKKLNQANVQKRDIMSDYRGGELSMKSTNFTGMKTGNMKSGSNIESNMAPLPPPSRGNAHGMYKTNRKSFKPLRHEGRLGAAISQDRKAYINNSGMMNRRTGPNYKSITNIASGNSSNGFVKNLTKSNSQAKNLQPLPDKQKNKINQQLEIQNPDQNITVIEGAPMNFNQQ